jgi:hypothetical protein
MGRSQSAISLTPLSPYRNPNLLDTTSWLLLWLPLPLPLLQLLLPLQEAGVKFMELYHPLLFLFVYPLLLKIENMV